MNEIEFKFNKTRAIGIVNGFFIKPLLEKGYSYKIRQNKEIVEVYFTLDDEPINGLKFNYLTGQLILSLKKDKAKNKHTKLSNRVLFTESLNNGITILKIDCKIQPWTSFIDSVNYIVDSF